MSDYYGNYGVESGYGQIAPGSTPERADVPGQPGRPRRQPGPQVVSSAVTRPGQQPAATAVQPFAGAQQTIGSGGVASPRPGGIESLQPEAPAPAAPPAEVATPAAPVPYQAKGAALGLEGFNGNKLSGGHVSPKYVFARAAQGLGVDDRDELLRRLQADESGYFKNASFGGSKGDKLMVGGELDPKFEGYNSFDVIRGMGEGGKAWVWQPEGGPAGAPAGGGLNVGPLNQGFGNGQLPPELLQMAISGQMPGGAQPQGDAQSYTERLRAQILGALQGQPGLNNLLG